MKFATFFLGIFLVAGLSVGLLVSVFLGFLWYNQERLLFLPPWVPPADDPKRIAYMEKHGVEDAIFTAADGVELHGWLWKRENPVDVSTMVVFLGNGGSPENAAEILTGLSKRLQVNVLGVSYRGYGLSKGTPTEHGVFLDADAALKFVQENDDLNKHGIHVFGHSLGGAVAIDLAKRRGSQLAGVIVQNTFTSIRDMLYHAIPDLEPLKLFIKPLLVISSTF